MIPHSVLTIGSVMAITLSLSAGTVQAQAANAVGLAASAPGSRLVAGEVTVRAKVIEVDASRRTVLLRGPKGNLVTVDVPPEVKNFDNVRVGDDLTLRYARAVAASLEPASNGGIRERTESTVTATAAPGSLPGVGAGRRIEVLAQVQSIDRGSRTVTLRGAKRTVVVAVPAGIDMAKVKVGSEVRAVFVEATVIEFKRTAATG